MKIITEKWMIEHQKPINICVNKRLNEIEESCTSHENFKNETLKRLDAFANKIEELDKEMYDICEKIEKTEKTIDAICEYIRKDRTDITGLCQIVKKLVTKRKK